MLQGMIHRVLFAGFTGLQQVALDVAFAPWVEVDWLGFLVRFVFARHPRRGIRSLRWLTFQLVSRWLPGSVPRPLPW